MTIKGIVPVLFALAACSESHGHVAPDSGSVGDSGNVDRDSSQPDAGLVDSGQPSEWTQCQGTYECWLRPASCCGRCGAATPEDVIAINAQYASDYSEVACSGGVGCPACYGETDPYLVTYCEANQCVARFLDETSDARSCQSDDDCAVVTSACCSCRYIAVRADIAMGWYSDRCDPAADCGPCGEPPPQAVCSAGACTLND